MNLLVIKKEDPIYYSIVKEILEHEEFIKRKKYLHHENRNVYDHSIMVSYLAYKMAKKLKLDYKSTAIGGLLHDFYPTPWMNEKGNSLGRTRLNKAHGFIHAYQGLINAYKFFPQLMNRKISDMILKHMFPLNVRPPKYAESWLVTIADKYISMEVFKTPSQLYKYIGIKKKE